jgi:16S rRNA (uracil1498-N3)-methyltransferase
MLPRFHAPELDADSRQATLSEDEGLHLTRVMRLGVGDDVAVFDGRGREFSARVASVTRDAVRVDLLEPLPPAPEAHTALTLVQVVLKGDRMDDVVRDATMMGVSEIVPVTSDHMAVKAQALERGRPAERWRRVALASAKQCRRATLPVIHDPAPFRAWLATAVQEARLLFVEPSATKSIVQASRAANDGEVDPLRMFMDRPAPRSAALIVGPEGGWSAEEVDAGIASGCTPVTLGGLTLRADAVPVVAISLVRFAFRDL